MSSMMPNLGQPPQQTQQEAGALGNRVVPPVRAIDKILMQQHQNKQALAFPMGIPQNEQPPQMQQQGQQPAATSFMASVLGNGPTGPR